MNSQRASVETLEKKVIQLAGTLKVAQQMIIGYDMRHPNEKQILNGFTNAEVKELIEKSLKMEL